MNDETIIFGTDGWRGLLDSQLNDGNITRVAFAFAAYIKQKGKNFRVAVGYDGRRNACRFAHLFALLLKNNNIEVLLSDRIVPTPVVSFACVYHKCDAGVMITASHNPPQYNGIKFKSADGSPFDTHETALVESLVPSGFPPFPDGTVEVEDIISPWCNHLENMFDFSAMQEAGLRVAIDSMAGAGGTLLQDMLRKHGVSAETIYGTPLTDFGGRHAEPIERNLEPLAQMLKNNGFSLGLATDGDADRLGVMDNHGQWMNVQETILYLARYYTKQRGIEGALVKTASVTDKMLSVLPDTEVVDVQVGFKYVAEAMIEKEAAFGAEESGGFGFIEHLPERDGIFSALVFLEMLAQSGHNKLDAFIKARRKELGEIHYHRIDLANDDPGRHEVLPHIKASPPAMVGHFCVVRTEASFSSRGVINGLKLRLEGNPRWLLLRVSETEPIVRIYAEGQNDEEVKMLLQWGKDMFKI